MGADRTTSPSAQIPQASTSVKPLLAQGSRSNELTGCPLPSVELGSSMGERFALDSWAVGWAVLYFLPGAPACACEDARQHRAFKRAWEAFEGRGVRVAGVSGQSPGELFGLTAALQLPQILLSDPGLSVACALGLETIEVDGRACYARSTLVVQGLVIRHVFSPVAEVARNPGQVLTWLRLHA